ncbi:uncharacterized protein LOC552749 isoform X6 [Apis mellifera]|uniref:Sodium/potassium-transporting ATPase subunit beta-1-interacting protein n=1 Tax=Apis mellifera TaxID=7460 RepID=A0A7M7IH57_APIME|nr:uncharacterized protein LOC552749 isoform X6 [Apis mellifera]|eukprot:XP_016769585.1 uncharacterized protein LOC552749 isoform X6 [Apis mellifera]
MGICNRRHFLLTICILQLITTVERQVFDFLGFMWAPILVNFFNIIFVILGFFGAFQYRPKYIISYCIWNTLWLGWNIFMICFYLNVGVLDKNSDILNLGTGSFSWWHVNGPGCKAIYDVTEPELFRPARPTNVTNCVLDYEIVEILHASTQCILGFIAIVGGIYLSKVFLEEDDSFDFVGGDDFGLAGHTPLHPMYVSYSALPSPAHPHKNSAQNYPAGTASSHQSVCHDTSFPKHNDKTFNSSGRSKCSFRNDTIKTDRTNLSNRDLKYVDYSNDYSNPLDHLQRPVSPYDEYDSLDSAAKLKYQKNKLYYPHSSKYSPVASPCVKSRPAAAKQNKASNKPRVFIDHVREQPMRSFYSDPRLAIENQQNVNDQEKQNRSKRDSRPLSLYATQAKLRKKKQPRPLYSIEYSQPEPAIHDDGVSPKPMTPRRVKRRSVISRDGTRRSSRRGQSSARQSSARRKNPVNRIMDHQESLYANTAGNVASNLTNQNVNSLSQGTLNYDRISMSWDRDRNSNWQHGEAVNMAVSTPALWAGNHPHHHHHHHNHNHNHASGGQDNGSNNGYSNGDNYAAGYTNWDNANSSSTRNLADNWQPSELSPMQWQGQSNPTFQQTSTQSLNGEDLDDIYNNRPASARSSYSNYHGVRATPQVPNRTDIVRQSQRQFVLSGPPAYQDTVI